MRQIIAEQAMYEDLPDVKSPCVVFLHGAGEKGDGTTVGLSNLEAFIDNPDNSIRKMLDRLFNGEAFGIIAPQLKWADGEWQNNYIDKAVDYAKSLPNVDPERVSLAGVSLGGGGVLKYLSVPGNGQKFNVAVPICPAYNTHDPKIIAASGIAMWFFHANDDLTCKVDTTNSAVSNINANNPAIPAYKTIYPTGGHYIWGTAFGTEALWLWMQKNRTTKRVPVTTTVPPATTPLVADAGPDITITTTTATLDGSKSTGGKSAWWGLESLNGKWSEKNYFDGSNFGLSVKLKDLIPGEYVYKLTNADGSNMVSDTVKLTVTGTVTPPPATGKKLLFTLGIYDDGTTVKA